VGQRDAKVLAQVCVNYRAKAGKFALILNGLKDGNKNVVNTWLNLLAVNFQCLFLPHSKTKYSSFFLVQSGSTQKINLLHKAGLTK
jgi:hypothetical protein